MVLFLKKVHIRAVQIRADKVYIHVLPMRVCNKYSYFSQGEKYVQMSREGKARVWHLNLSTETRSVEVDKSFISQMQGNTVYIHAGRLKTHTRDTFLVSHVTFQLY